jgi:chromosome segregation ATPase
VSTEALSVLIASGVFLVALIVFVSGMFKWTARATDQTAERALSLREHQEFKGGVDKELTRLANRQDLRLEIREFNEWRIQISADLKRVDAAINRVEADLRTEIHALDQKKPAVGELREGIQAIKDRIAIVEEQIKRLAPSVAP